MHFIDTVIISTSYILYTRIYTKLYSNMQNNNICLIGFIFNLFDLQYVSSTINITILLHTSISITIYNGKYKYNTIHYYV